MKKRRRNYTHKHTHTRYSFSIMADVNMGGVRTAHSSLFFVASTRSTTAAISSSFQHKFLLPSKTTFIHLSGCK